MTDPITIVRQLDADAIRKRIDTLDQEREALMVLLRAARRTQREQDGRARREGAAHA